MIYNSSLPSFKSENPSYKLKKDFLSFNWDIISVHFIIVRKIEVRKEKHKSYKTEVSKLYSTKHLLTILVEMTDKWLLLLVSSCQIRLKNMKYFSNITSPSRTPGRFFSIVIAGWDGGDMRREGSVLVNTVLLATLMPRQNLSVLLNGFLAFPSEEAGKGPLRISETIKSQGFFPEGKESKRLRRGKT